MKRELFIQKLTVSKPWQSEAIEESVQLRL